MSLIAPGIPATIAELVQDRTLERVIRDALFPRQLYRLEAIPELWAAQLGEQQIFTRTGLMVPAIDALVPGQDPDAGGYQTEQWEVFASQYGKSVDTHMPTSYVAIAPLFSRNTQNLGINAGQTLNRLARNKLFAAYGAGEASVRVAVAAAGTQISVATLDGLTQVIVNGRLQGVSSASPLPVTFSTVGEPANAIVGITPDDPQKPFGPGIISLQSPLTVGVAARDVVLASTRSRRLRVGGAASIDGLSGANILTLDAVISAVARLREMSVPTHADGTYHVHLGSQAEAEIFRDNHWQRMYQSLPDSYEYKEFAVGRMIGCTFFRNEEDPNPNTCQDVISIPGGAGGARLAREMGLEIVNANGLPVRRTIVTGGGALYEKYLDESQYITMAGVTGKIGNFSVTNQGVQVMTDRIRYIVRSPLDALQQVVRQTWSWSGDFGIPSDLLTGDSARYKRAVIIEHS